MVEKSESGYFWSKGYIHGDGKRLFINTSLGCSASCAYCYLPHIGLKNGNQSVETVMARSVLDEFLSGNIFRPGKNGSIISIGCFSECWDQKNIMQTKEILKSILKYGNPVQLATKKYINYIDLLDVIDYIKWEGQLSIFVSCTTIKFWDKYEKGTEPPSARFHTFDLTKKIAIPTYLYIKPVIKDITIHDIENFRRVLEKYEAGAVVGHRFSVSETELTAPVGNGQLYYANNNEVEVIREKLSSSTRTYLYSTTPINERRGML